MEHPDITHIERDGFINQPTGIITCTKCSRELDEGEWYGAFDGRTICIECAREELSNKSDPDIIEMLGYRIERAVY